MVLIYQSYFNLKFFEINTMHAHVNYHCRGYFYVQFYLCNLFLTLLGFHCWVGFPLVMVPGLPGLLFIVTSLVPEHGLSGAQAPAAAACGLSSCGSWALERSLS